MFDFLKKKPSPVAHETAKFSIDGMHCSSCSLTIDDELEETDGVLKSSTSYAKAKTVVDFDPQKISTEKIQQVIESLEYSAKLVK